MSKKPRKQGLQTAPASRAHNVLSAFAECPIVPPEILGEWLAENSRTLSAVVLSWQESRSDMDALHFAGQRQAAGEVLNALDFLDLAQVAMELVASELTPREAQAMTLGLRLGMVRERLQSLARDDFHRAWQQSDRGAKGAVVTNEAHRELHPEYFAAVQELMAAGAGYHAATEAVGKKLAVSGRTVRKYTGQLAPRKRGRPPTRK